MKKIFTATLLVLISFTLTGCSLLGNKKDSNTGNINEEQTESIKAKIEDIFSMGGNKECKYTMTVEGMESKGTMYIADKKVFNTATINIEGIEQSMNYLLDEEWMYSWGTSLPAMKMNLKQMEQMNKDTKDIEVENKDKNIAYDKLGLKEDMNLDCKNWIVDNSKFELPKDLEFKDITQTLNNFNKQYEQTNQKVDDLKNDMCGACNMTPDEETKRECLASLGCN